MNTNAQERQHPARQRSASIPVRERSASIPAREEESASIPAREKRSANIPVRERSTTILLAETSRNLEGRPPLTTPLRVLYFAQAAEATGCRSETWEITGPITAEQFWQEAIRRHPDLANLRSQCRLAVNHAFLDHPGESIPPQSEVAVLPPVSGG